MSLELTKANLKYHQKHIAQRFFQAYNMALLPIHVARLKTTLFFLKFMTLDPEKDKKMWGMFCHLSALAGLIGIPFGNILGPLIVWLSKKQEIPFVEDQGKESLNFQITMTLITLVAFLSIFLMVGFLLVPVVIIANLVFVIIGAIKANEGVPYRYPFALRLIK